MKVLVIGSGGREHALCHAFAKNPKVKVYCAPGNGGTLSDAINVNIGVKDFKKLAGFAEDEGIDFTFVGPEIPLAEGIADFFQDKGLKIIGPSKRAAMLESSKIFSKEFMSKYGVPTARFEKFSNSRDALKFLETWETDKKIVVKADGLAAGKGVYMCNARRDAVEAVNAIMTEKVLGEAGTNVLIEEYIDGPELSYLIFTDGVSYSIMPASQDHKRINDNDEGPNTGGMGAYAPAPLADEELNKKVEDKIIKKVMEGIGKEGLEYKGVLYIGIIMNAGEPYVLEFNCRFGDPETQAVLPLLDTDLSDICLAILDKKLSGIEMKWKNKTAVCVVLASGGYPGKFESGFEISGLDQNLDENTYIFHAGTKPVFAPEKMKREECYGTELLNRVTAESVPHKVVTSGGRVLAVTSIGSDIRNAVDKVYSEVNKISFKNMHFRKDIAWRALNAKRS